LAITEKEENKEKSVSENEIVEEESNDDKKEETKEIEEEQMLRERKHPKKKTGNNAENSENIEDGSNEIINASQSNDLDTKQLSENSEILLNAYDAASEQDFPDNISEQELNKLLDEAISRQKHILDDKKKKESLERLEYDSVHESFSSINFHMSLLFLLGVLTLINLPATVSWAKNYSYNPRLSPDPSFIPAMIVLVSISLLWQFGAPRNVHGYNMLSGAFYGLAVGCILYCQDSLYRLNYVIPGVFIIITLQQLFFPKKPEENQEEQSDKDLKNKIERMKTLLEQCGDLESAD